MDSLTSGVKYRPMVMCGDEANTSSLVSSVSALVPPALVPPTTTTPTTLIRDVMSAAAAAVAHGSPNANVNLQLTGGDVAHYALMAKTQSEWQAAIEKYREQCTQVLATQKASAKAKREALQMQLNEAMAQLQTSEAHLRVATERIAAVGLVKSVPACGETPSVRGVCDFLPSGVAPITLPAGI